MLKRTTDSIKKSIKIFQEIGKLTEYERILKLIDELFEKQDMIKKLKGKIDDLEDEIKVLKKELKSKDK